MQHLPGPHPRPGSLVIPSRTTYSGLLPPRKGNAGRSCDLVERRLPDLLRGDGLRPVTSALSSIASRFAWLPPATVGAAAAASAEMAVGLLLYAQGGFIGALTVI